MDAINIVAHRGDNTNFPENSYSGIESALKAGALFVEFDIQMNKDGSLIVIHDADFNRTAGVDLSVFDAGDNKVKKISAHHPEKFTETHYPTPVPFLSDIINLLKKFPKSKALVELKNESIDFWGLEKVMKELLRELEDSVSQCIIIGYSNAALEYTHNNSKHQTGLVFNQYLDEIRKTAKKLKPDFMICPYDIIPDSVWKGSWQWMVYSINDKELAKRLLQRKDIDLIETDDIHLILLGD